MTPVSAHICILIKDAIFLMIYKYMINVWVGVGANLNTFVMNATKIELIHNEVTLGHVLLNTSHVEICSVQFVLYMGYPFMKQ